ncbi:MAG: PRC-barrel domain-containing protein [Verrucomicrobia subdivision 3 bacterium]|nr:PRC-barrel domain-containing protein [Limisphaerales bacterium]
MKRTFVLNGAIAAAALLTWTSANAAETRHLGKIDDAKELISRDIQGPDNQKIGDLKEVVVDLESGRVLYAIVGAGGFLGIGDELTAVPPGAFTSSSTRLTVSADKQKLLEAPRFAKDQEKQLADAEFVKRIHQHFGQQTWWEKSGGSFKNAHKASELMGMNVKNASDQGIGDIANLGIDLPGGRVAFVILGTGGVLGAGDKQYAIPPNAFTLGADNKSLVINLDKEKLANAPQITADTWRQLSDPRFAARVYQHYGKQPYWDVPLTPTGREDNSRAYQDKQQDRISRDRDADRTRDDRIRERNERIQGRAIGDFANVEEAKKLIGMNLRASDGDVLGKLSDMVVDLEPGRVIYGIVNLQGRGGMKAVAPQTLSPGSDDKSLRFMGDEAKLNAAPSFDRNADLHNAQFASSVYTHFGQQAWFATSGKFGNVHKTSDVMKMKVENVQNENLGQVQNLMVDLSQARVLYVIMSVAPSIGRGDHLLAVPPSAFTLSPERKTLVSDADKSKLEGAPRFTRANLRELANPARATEIYRYYGKQAYWDTSGATPTGRSDRRVYPDRQD